ncbi:glycosyltransferase family 4 protein [Dyadobacter crusticola]|uniref:glycosyltransferase family 4 protein n=1 Tax=Dyadobacter crusticola TaxID=292407 RepID=UPI000A013453|nr:glycosyltransferase family 4 protein [Dyadobacter crusticola]
MDETSNISPLKVLMTADTVGGVWTYSVELCRALADYNVHFHLVTMGAKMQPWQAAEIGALGNVTVYETGYKLEWMENPWEEVDEAGSYLLSLQKAVQADLVHLNGFVHGALKWDVPVISVAHSDVFSWFRAVEKTTPPADWDTYFAKVQRGLQHADHIVAPSRAMMTELDAIYSLHKNHSVIYNTRRADRFFCGKKEKSVLCMGRIWDEAKNVKLLTDAAPSIHYPIQIAGETHFENNSTEVQQSNIIHLGKLGSEAISKALSTASVYALPARYEPFGLSVLEAALSHCALVLGDIPSLREIWQDHAIYVDTGNPQELADTINALMQDEENLNKMAEKAFQRAQQFTTSKMGSSYAGLYQQLVKQFEAAQRNIL